MFVFFVSSRRRQTICALVTGVQTCALPIYLFLFSTNPSPIIIAGYPNRPLHVRGFDEVEHIKLRAQLFWVPFIACVEPSLITAVNRIQQNVPSIDRKSRSVGKACVRKRRSRWSPYQYK